MADIPSGEDHVGRPMDVVPFGEITRWNEDGTDCGVVWEDPRDVFRVVVEFAGAAEAPPGLRLQYWQSAWPHQRIPRDKPSGAGRSGWLNVGDWFQGEWKDADATVERSGETFTFTFNPVNLKEFPQIEAFDAVYRTTLKLRVVADARLPEVVSFAAYTDSVWRAIEIEIEWKNRAKDAQTWGGRLDVFNGRAAAVRGAADGVRAQVLYAATQAVNSFDETIVTVRAAHETFSFAVSDLLKWGHIFIPDYGVVVRTAGSEVTYASAEKAWRECADKDVYTRVAALDEQTLSRAWGDTPPKGHHMIPLGFEGGRQHFGLDEHGALFCIKKFHERVPASDSPRCAWTGDKIEYRFGLDNAQFIERTLADRCLPIVTTTFERDGVRHRQTAFVVPLKGVPKSGERILAEDTLVCLVRFEMQLMRDAETVARLDLAVHYAERDEDLAVEDGWIVGKTETSRPRRMYVRTVDALGTFSLLGHAGMIEYRAPLTSTRPRRTVEIVLPYIALDDKQEYGQAETIEFDGACRAVQEYWRGRVAASAQIHTPESMIDEFYKAHVSHLLLTTEREVGGSDRYMARVGSFWYGVFANEACMVISDLDRRGLHALAERAIETWLHYQGSVALPGDYSTKDGVLYGAGGYEHGGYNQHHGWVLWCLGEHYWYTRDDAWLARAAPHIVEGCEWLIKERARTVEVAGRSPIRAIARGLLPPGSLEDIGDWRPWLSTNAYSWWGMRNSAAALHAAGHPDGRRLLDEAEAYRTDLVRAFTAAMQRSPVVRLRDGRWIPHVPSEVHRRGRSHGWITETLEGAMHLVITCALEPYDRRSTWIIQDYEDNRYISPQYGYDFTGDEYERRWFSQGGISMQANLLLNPIPYLLRDEPKHFLRAYFNAFAVSFFPDTRMMTEHALPAIGDWWGDHYKSSDEANSTYFLRLMFIMERGKELWLGAAIPRYWLADGQTLAIENAATHFGRISMTLESRVARGEIEMWIEPPRRNPPKVVRARFRHPDAKRMTRCEVNGKPHLGFDPAKEWVVLDECAGPCRIVAFYM